MQFGHNEHLWYKYKGLNEQSIILNVYYNALCLNNEENTPIYSSVVLFDIFFIIIYIYSYIFGLLPTLSLIKN